MKSSEPSASPRLASLAWIGQVRAAPRSLAVAVTSFEDSDDFLIAPDPYGFDFYVVDLRQRGVRGIDLVRLIRRRSAAGIAALCNETMDEFVAALDSGADMVLRRDSPPAHLQAAVAAVRRRSQQAAAANQAHEVDAAHAALPQVDHVEVEPVRVGRDQKIVAVFKAGDGHGQ